MINCISGEVQNFVGIHPTRGEVEEAHSDGAAELKDAMLQEFSHFHPDILKIFQFVISNVSSIGI